MPPLSLILVVTLRKRRYVDLSSSLVTPLSSTYLVASFGSSILTLLPLYNSDIDPRNFRASLETPSYTSSVRALRNLDLSTVGGT